MDVQNPGSNLPGITGPAGDGILRLGGALRVPDQDLTDDQLAERNRYEDWDEPYPQPFQSGLAAFINLADDYAAQAAAAANAATGLGPGVDDDPDPLITSPLYGRWHALTQRLLTNRDGTPAPILAIGCTSSISTRAFASGRASAPMSSSRTPRST